MTNSTDRRSAFNTTAISPWWALAAAPVAAAAAWIAYSALAIDHDQELPPALPGDRFEVDTAAGRVSLYADGPRDGIPLVLVHSVNAAASAYEVRPLYLHYRSARPVYAIDLPGFGLSERSDRIYTPRLMADALHAAVSRIRSAHNDQTVDVIALSLSCEYAARAALERPEDYRSLGLVSPTGLDKALSGEGRAQSTRGSMARLRAASVPLWSRALFDLFVSRPSMRFFLKKTWGSDEIDEGLFEYDQVSAHQPGAEHVVWSFLSGFLFADDISRIYKLLELPVWEVHGTRGDFVDYRYESDVEDRPNWSFDEFDTGAFPHFERLDAVTRSYSRFQGAIEAAETLSRLEPADMSG